MMKKSLIIVLFISFFTFIYSQSDSLTIPDQIFHSELSKSDLISRSRRLILQKIEEGDKDAVWEIMDYLAQEVDDEDHLSLWIPERWLLCYWIGDYEQILGSVLDFNVNEDFSQSYGQAILPPDELIAQKVVKNIRNSFDFIVSDFESLNFSEDSSDFLYLFLNRLILDYDNTFTSMDQIHEMSDAFITKYPNSHLVKVVKEITSSKYQAGDWGVGIALGGGFAFDSGNITDYINQSGGITFGFDLYYRRYYLGFSAMGTFGKVAKNINIKGKNQIWYEGEDIPVTLLTPVFGFALVDYKRIKITPFGGVSFNLAAPSEDDKADNPELKGLSLGTSVTPVFGLNADFVLNNPKKSGPDSYISEDIYTLGIKATYQPDIITTQGGDMKGSLFFLGLVFKIYLYPAK